MTFSISGLGPLPFDPATHGQIPGVDDLGVPFHDILDDKRAADAAPRDAHDYGEDDQQAGPRADRADDGDDARDERRADDDRDDPHADRRSDERDRERDPGDAREDRSARDDRGADDDGTRTDDDRDTHEDDGATARNEATDGDDDVDTGVSDGDDGVAGTGEGERAAVDGDAAERQAQAAAQNPQLTDAALPQDAQQSEAGDTGPTASDGAAAAATQIPTTADVAAAVQAEQLALLAEYGIGPAGLAAPGEILPDLARLSEDGEPGIDLSQALRRLLTGANAGAGGQTGNNTTGQNNGQQANTFAGALQGGNNAAQSGGEIVINRPAQDPQLQALPTPAARVSASANQPAQTPTAPVPTVDPGAASQATGGTAQSGDPLATKASSQSAAPSTARPQALSTNAGIQVAIQLSRAIQDGFDRLSVRLNPPELGRVDIKLEVANDGRALAVISAERQDTLDLLQRDSRGLERALQEAGLRADSGSLSFNLRQQGGDGEQQANGNGKPGSAGDGDGEDDAEQSLPHVASDRVLDISV